MPRDKLPAIRLEVGTGPTRGGPAMRAPKSALERWNKDIQAAPRKTQDAVEVAILTDIGDEMWGGFSAATMKRKLDAADGAPILVTLNSPGGDAFEGVAIYNLLRAHAGSVTVNVIGMAASAASVIAMAGDRIEMQPGTQMMIHSAWGLVIGNQQDLREFADILDKLDRSIADVYAARTGLDTEQVLEMMHKETWMTGKEAKDNGFADVAHTGKDSAKTRAQAHPVVSLAASGDQRRPVVNMSARSLPGASGPVVNLSTGATMPTIQERIAALEATRAAKAARMQTLSSTAADSGNTFDAAQQEEFDTLDQEVRSIDAQLARDRRAAEVAVLTARPAGEGAGSGEAAAGESRRPNGAVPTSGIIAVGSRLEKGVPFARYAMAMVRAQGHQHQALQIVQSNKRWMNETPQIAQFLMAAVGAGTRGDEADLTYATNLAGDFIEFLRPSTIVGQLDGRLRRVPFNIRVGSATGGTAAHWVGEARPIPMSRMTTGVVTLGRTKLAGLTSITDELAQDSSPSAEILVRNDLRDAVVQLMDSSFIDPDRAAVAGVSPASITNGVAAIPPTGPTAADLRADVATIFDRLIAAGIRNFAGGAWIATGPVAVAMSLMTNPLGQPEFPTVTPQGGTFMGYPLIVSQGAVTGGSPTEDLLIFVLPGEIMIADDGEVDIKVSMEAAIEMSDTPANAADTGAGTTMVSMFQTDSLAVRAVRFVNWQKRRPAAAQYIRGAAYRA